jgi:ankyrin repeat protein
MKDVLINACIAGDIRSFKKSFKSKNDLHKKYYGQQLIRWAIQEGHLNIVKFLIDQGANIKKRYTDGFTSLDQAVGEGHLEIVKFLIKVGANVNQRTCSGTALHTACAYGRTAIAKILINNGANTHIKNKSGLTPRWYAGYFRRKGLVKYLRQIE